MSQRPMPVGVFMVIMAMSIGGCGIWESNEHPDYQSTRADFVCHPYGNCISGHWVPLNPLEADQPQALASHALCAQGIDRGHEEIWWKESVTRGLEIGACMRQLGFRLQQ